MQRQVPFTKMSGSGNDFVVIDHRQPLLANDEIARFTRAVCRRGLGIGADGVILHGAAPAELEPIIAAWATATS